MVKIILGMTLESHNCRFENRFILKLLIFTSIFQANQLKKLIEDMAEQSLRCIAFAYRNLDMKDVPSEEQRINWQLPDNELTLIGIIGMKVYDYELASVEFYCLLLSFPCLFVGSLSP
jgi:hypothetical protein